MYRGGNSTYLYVHPVLNRGSEPVALDGYLIDEGPRIHSLEIVNVRIVLMASIHSPTDSMARPTRRVANEYVLVDGDLELVSQIDLPEPAEDLTGEDG